VPLHRPAKLIFSSNIPVRVQNIELHITKTFASNKTVKLEHPFIIYFYFTAAIAVDSIDGASLEFFQSYGAWLDR